jgi:hypothetical protein
VEKSEKKYGTPRLLQIVPARDQAIGGAAWICG